MNPQKSIELYSRQLCGFDDDGRKLGTSLECIFSDGLKSGSNGYRHQLCITAESVRLDKRNRIRNDKTAERCTVGKRTSADGRQTRL